MKPSFIKLLKKNIEKMSIFRLSTMLMKTNELNHSLHDVDEKKEERRWTEIINSELSIAADAKPAHRLIG